MMKYTGIYQDPYIETCRYVVTYEGGQLYAQKTSEPLIKRKVVVCGNCIQSPGYPMGNWLNLPFAWRVAV